MLLISKWSQPRSHCKHLSSKFEGVSWKGGQVFLIAPKGQNNKAYSLYYSVTRLNWNHEQFKLSHDILVGNENAFLTFGAVENTPFSTDFLSWKLSLSFANIRVLSSGVAKLGHVPQQLGRAGSSYFWPVRPWWWLMYNHAPARGMLPLENFKIMCFKIASEATFEPKCYYNP